MSPRAPLSRCFLFDHLTRFATIGFAATLPTLVHAQCNPSLWSVSGYNNFGNALRATGDLSSIVVASAWSGGAAVYTNNGTTWTQRGNTLVRPGNASGYWGEAVAISGDGGTVCINSPDQAGGSAYIYVWSAGSWVQQGPPLSGGGGAYDYTTGSVALSADGNTLAIGASGEPGGGAVYVYARSNGIWTQHGPTLYREGADRFGRSVSLTDSGDLLLVGAETENGWRGAAYIFERTQASWTLQARLTPIGDPESITFGSSVALTPTGTVAVIGARNGGVYSFTHSGSSWIQAAAINPGVHGQDIAVSADGKVAFVAGATSEGGGVRVCDLVTGSTVGSLGGGSAGGGTLSCNSDGTRVAVGSPAANSWQGNATVYAINSPLLVEQPIGVSVTPGATATLSIAAQSSLPVSFQWRSHGQPVVDGPTGTGSVITGSNTALLAVSLTTLADNLRVFDCVVGNTCGTITTFPVAIGVNPAATNSCIADLGVQGGIFGHDRRLDNNDFIAFIDAFFSQTGCP